MYYKHAEHIWYDFICEEVAVGSDIVLKIPSRFNFCRYSYQSRCKLSVQHAVTVSSMRLILSDAHMEHTSWCSNGAYSTLLNWSLYYAYDIMIFPWTSIIQKILLWMLLFILIQYDISMICYDTKDNLMAYAIALNYCILYVLKLVNDTVPTWTIWAKSVSCVLRTQGEC